ncbi:protein of unknown function [Agrobacterium pusense]|uniref:Uncharacterized protein n=1 Tax=Agrobacterium pusense TaxID=648995 RepID=U4Q9L9_9HYPH|nr:protein of unknown function [Agrobacterium pusense]
MHKIIRRLGFAIAESKSAAAMLCSDRDWLSIRSSLLMTVGKTVMVAIIGVPKGVFIIRWIRCIYLNLAYIVSLSKTILH